MPTFTDAKRERVRESLRETGRELFARYGLDKTAISELTEAAGIEKGTFYQFYDSKDELYLEILEAYSEEVAPRLMDNCFEAYDDPEQAIAAFLDEIMDEFESNPLIHRIIVEDQLDRLRAQYSDDEIEAERERSIEYFLPYIERWYNEGRVTGPDPETIAQTILTVALLPYSELPRPQGSGLPASVSERPPSQRTTERFQTPQAFPSLEDSAYPVPICSTGVDRRASTDAGILFKSRSNIGVSHVACLVVPEGGNPLKTVGLHPRGQAPRFSSSVFYRGHLTEEDQYPAIRETLIATVTAGVTDGTDESHRTEDDHE